MAMTLAEKIIARAAGQEQVHPGQIVTCRVDLAMVHDSSGPRRLAPMLEAIGATVWDPDRLVVITDHFVNETDTDSLRIQEVTREWVEHNGVHRYHPAQGICHIVLPEAGYLQPGMFLVGADSHSVTAGAFGCFMVGIGVTEMAGVLATGEIWIRTPTTLRVEVTGALPPAVVAKDVMLQLCASIGIMGANYKAVQFSGSAVTAMSMDERMVLSNMSAELGAKTGLIEADDQTLEFLRRTANNSDSSKIDSRNWRGDSDAHFEQTLLIDADSLEPQVAAPHSPENARPVHEHNGTRLDQAFIGACTGAKLADLRMAAAILKNQEVRIPLFIAPASMKIQRQAAEEGLLDIFTACGAQLLPTGCGACIGLGPARLGEHQTGISSSSRNFKGRMGAPSSGTYLASPCTVAASAVHGCIADPREQLA